MIDNDERGRWLIGVCLFGIHMMLGGTIAVAGDWPSWRGPHGSGSWTAPDIESNWESNGPVLVWKQEIGPGYSGIAVAEGRVFTLDRTGEKPGRERVVCLDARSGAPIWRHEYPADYEKLDYGKGPRSTPTVNDRLVYTLGAVGHLYCLDTRSGAVRWSKELKRDHAAEQPTWGFAASPVIYHDLVIVHAGLRPNGCFVAYHRQTGEEVWRSGEDPAGYSTPIIANVGDRELLIGWTPEHIVGLSLIDGRMLWEVPYKVTYGVSIASPVYHDGTLFVSGYWEGAKAIRLNPDQGNVQLLWEENRFLRALMDQPLCRDGHAYMLDKARGLVCFKLDTGQVVWTDNHQLTPRGRNPQASLVWVNDSDRAVSLNSNGELMQLRLTPAGYEELSRFKIVNETWAHPAYSDHFVFARDDSQIVSFKLPLTNASGR